MAERTQTTEQKRYHGDIAKSDETWPETEGRKTVKETTSTEDKVTETTTEKKAQ